MDTFEFFIDEKLRPSAERKLTGTTHIDSKISSLIIPQSPFSIRLGVILLRLYRKISPQSLRCRCVFDPSCSHYSELAIRQYGVMKGSILTLFRLTRCKPGAGGIDFSHLKQGV